MKLRSSYLLTGIVLWLAGCALGTAAARGADIEKLAGQPADVAPGATNTVSIGRRQTTRPKASSSSPH